MEKVVKAYWGYNDLSKFTDKQVYGMYHYTLRRQKIKPVAPTFAENNKWSIFKSYMDNIVEFVNNGHWNTAIPCLAELVWEKEKPFARVVFTDTNARENSFVIYVNEPERIKKLYTYNADSAIIVELSKRFELEIVQSQRRENA